MATKKVTTVETIDFDLNTFKKQKEQLVRVANSQVAQKIIDIRNIISEIKNLVELSGINIKLMQEIRYYIDEVDEMNPDWNSSSYDC